MTPVPFAIENVHGGLSRAKGRVSVDDVWLVFEVETRVMNLFTTASRTLRLDLTELDTVQHRRGLFGDTLTLTPQRGSALSGLPGGGAGELTLRIARRHRAALAGLLDRLRLWTV